MSTNPKALAEELDRIYMNSFDDEFPCLKEADVTQRARDMILDQAEAIRVKDEALRKILGAGDGSGARHLIYADGVALLTMLLIFLIAIVGLIRLGLAVGIVVAFLFLLTGSAS